MTVHYREMIRHLEGLGCIVISHSGSHRKFKAPKGEIIIVPVHPNRRTIAPGIYHKINKQLFNGGYTTEKISI